MACPKSSLEASAEDPCAFSVEVTDLDFVTRYRVLLRGRNSQGWGGVAFGVVTTFPAAPAAPRDLSSEARDGGLALTWIAGADNGAPISAYQYRSRPVDAQAWSSYRAVPPECTDTVVGTECSLEVAGLTNGIEYEVELRAVSAAGFGDKADARGMPRLVDLAAVVGDLRQGSPECTASFKCKVPFTWSTPVAGCPDRYEYSWSQGDWRSVRCSQQGTACQRADDAEADCEGAATESLDAGASLVFRVRPVQGELVGQETSVTVVIGYPPEAPLSPRASPGDGQATLSWAAPGGPVQRYEYRFRVAAVAGASAGSWSDWNDAGLALKAVILGLTNDREYDFEVRAVNAAGEGRAAGSGNLYGVKPVGGASPPGAPGHAAGDRGRRDGDAGVACREGERGRSGGSEHGQRTAVATAPAGRSRGRPAPPAALSRTRLSRTRRRR